MQLKSLTIFATGIVNRKKTSHKTLICVRPENPVLVPFDWTTTMVWIVQEQTIVMNVTDGGTDLKSRANNSSSEARRQAHVDRQEMVLCFRLLKLKGVLSMASNFQNITQIYKPSNNPLIENTEAYQVRHNVQQFFVMVYFFKDRMNHRRWRVSKLASMRCLSTQY